MSCFVVAFAMATVALFGAGAGGKTGFRWRWPGAMASGAVAIVWLTLLGGGPLSAATPSYVLVGTIGTSGSGNSQFNGIRRVATNSAGDVLVADVNNNRIEEFDPNGNYLQSIGSRGSGNGQVSGPQGVAADGSGNVWVADSGNNRVEEFNSSGGFIQAFGSNGSGAGQISESQAIAVDGSGNVWINDWWNNRIDEFTGNGTFVQMFGSNGSGTGQFAWLGGLTTDLSGNVYVTDSQNNRVQKFNSSGVYLQTFGTGQLSFPGDVARDQLGNIWAASTNNHALVEFNSAGTYLGQIALSYSPVSLAFTPAGTLWVADQSDNHLLEYQLISPQSAWNVDAGGNWSAVGNWINGVPNAANASALFGGAISAPRTISVDAAMICGTLTFSSPAKYTIAGPQAITLLATAADAAINVAGGTHEIAANLVLATTVDITVTNANDQLTLSGNISGSGVALNMNGAGTLVLSNSNTFSGTTTINGGTLTAAAASALSPNSPIIVNGGLLNVAAGPQTVSSLSIGTWGAVKASSPLRITSTLNLPSGVTATLTGPGAPGFGVSGANLADAAQASTLTLSGGVLTITSSGQPGTAINVSLSAESTGGGFSNAGPYSGLGPSSDTGTVWNNPTAANTTTSALLTSSNAATTATFTTAGIAGQFSSGVTSKLLSGYVYANPGTMTFTFGGLTPGMQYDLYAISQSNAVGRATAFTTGGTTQTVTTASNYTTTTVTSPSTYAEFVGLTPNGNNQVIVTASTASTLHGNEVDVNGFQLVPLNVLPASLTLPNTSIAVTASSTLSLPPQTVTLGSLTLFASGSPALTLTGAVSLTLGNSGGSAISATGTNGAAAIIGSMPIQIAAGSVNVDAGASLSIGVPIQNGASPTALTKVGSGTLILTASNTYSGGTLVSAGALVVNGSLLSPVTVNSGGTLAGTGHLTTVTVAPGGILAPGDAPGTLTLSGIVNLESGAVMDFELDTPSTSDMITCSAFFLNNQQFSNFNFTATANFGPGTYDLINAGSISGNLASNSGTVDGLPATLAVSNNELVLTVVPEPSTAALFGAGVAVLIGWATRRRNAR